MKQKGELLFSVDLVGEPVSNSKIDEVLIVIQKWFWPTYRSNA